MAWPFNENKPNDPEAKDEPKPEAKPEKTPAELIADSLRPVTDGFAALNQRLEQLEQGMVRRPERQESAERAEPISVLDDENAAFAQRVGPIMLRQLELEARVVRNDIRAEYQRDGYGDLWAQYEAEINQVLEGTPVANMEGKALRGDPQYIRNVVDMVFGRAARKAGMKFGGKDRGFFLESAGATGESNPQPVNDGLSNDQRRVFNRMKIPIADAQKVMTKLKFIS